MIIGLTGIRLLGKDTVGRYLVENYGFQRVGIADKLREAVAALFDIEYDDVNRFKGDRDDTIPLVEINIDIGGTTRYTYGWVEFLQRFGTEMGREVFGWDFWINQALPTQIGWRGDDGVWHSKVEGSNIVVTDVRFDNEAERIVDLGGIIIKIVRPEVEVGDSHESEAGISNSFISMEIHNTKDLNYLYHAVDEIMEAEGFRANR